MFTWLQIFADWLVYNVFAIAKTRKILAKSKGSTFIGHILAALSKYAGKDNPFAVLVAVALGIIFTGYDVVGIEKA